MDLRVFADKLGCEVLGLAFMQPTQTTQEEVMGGVEESHLSMQPGGKPVTSRQIQPEKGSER